MSEPWVISALRAVVHGLQQVTTDDDYSGDTMDALRAATELIYRELVAKDLVSALSETERAGFD